MFKAILRLLGHLQIVDVWMGIISVVGLVAVYAIWIV